MSDYSAGTRTIVVASSFVAYTFYLSANGLSRQDHAYAQDFTQLAGLLRATPVVILEGYQYNKNNTIWFMSLIGNRFADITFVTEAEMYDKQIEIQRTVH